MARDRRSTFPLRVTAYDPPAALTFEGGMPLGLFKGVRTYRLTRHGDSGTEFEMQEVYSGLLRGLIGRTVPDLNPSFETFARGLKERAESAQHH